MVAEPVGGFRGFPGDRGVKPGGFVTCTLSLLPPPGDCSAMRGGLACDKGGSLRKGRSTCQHQQLHPIFPQVGACGSSMCKWGLGHRQTCCACTRSMCKWGLGHRQTRSMSKWGLGHRQTRSMCKWGLGHRQTSCACACHKEGFIPQVEKACGSMSKCGRLATRWTLLGVVLLCVVIVTWIGFCGLDQEERGDSIERQSLSGLKLDIPPDHESRGGEDTQEMFSDSGAAGNRPAGVTGRLETGDLHAAGEQAILDCDREKDNDLGEEDLRSVGDATHLLHLHSLNSKDLGIEKRTQVQVAVHASFKRINMPWDRGKAFKGMGALKRRLEHAASRIDCRGLFSSFRNSSRTPPQSRIPDRSRPRSRTPDRSRPSPRQFPSSPAPRTGSPYPVDQARASVSASGGGGEGRNAEDKVADQDPRFVFVSTISGGCASADQWGLRFSGQHQRCSSRRGRRL
jgi:hypothetical protein